LIEKYNKRSRQLLTDEELLSFLSYLKSSQVSFKVGQRVKLNMPGSVRHGMVGTVVRLKTDGSEQELIVKFDDRKLRRDLRQMECYADWLFLD
jgi:ribosomal protein L21E